MSDAEKQLEIKDAEIKRLQTDVYRLKAEVSRWHDAATTQQTEKLLIKSKAQALLEAIQTYHNNMCTEMWIEVTDAAKELQ